ncbi:MAG: hypothetical protein ABJD11_06420 [Gemmatimonadota bacterium]
MEPEEVAARVEREVREYEYRAPAGARGKAWTPARVLAELAALERALILPRRAEFEIRDAGVQLTDPEPEIAPYWLVARDSDGTLVFYDEAADDFGLGEVTPEGNFETVGVRGELVNIFLAR